MTLTKRQVEKCIDPIMASVWSWILGISGIIIFLGFLMLYLYIRDVMVV